MHCGESPLRTFRVSLQASLSDTIGIVLFSDISRNSTAASHHAIIRTVALAFVFLTGGGVLSAQDNLKTLSLHDAVQQALASPLTQVFEADVQQAQGSVRQAGLGPNPKLYLQSEDLRPWDDSFNFADHTEDYAYIGQTIEVAGKRGKRVALANARLRQTEAYRSLGLRQLAGRVTLAYWTAVSQQRIAQLLHDDIAAVDEMVRYHKERVDAGAMKGVDLLRMQVERDRLAIALQAAERDAVQSRLDLFKQMGTAPSDARLVDPLDSVPEIAPVDTGTILLQRPDVQSARSAVDAAESDLKLQRANAIPDPDLFGGYKRNTGDNTGYGGLQLSLPLRNRNQGEIERARASLIAARASLVLREQQVRIEVDQANAAYLAQRKVVENTLPDMRLRAKQNLDIIREAYRIGGVDLLRFIDAERTEFEVEVAAVRAQAELQQYAVQLQLAYGVQP